MGNDWKPDPLSKWATFFLIVVFITAILYLVFTPGVPS